MVFEIFNTELLGTFLSPSPPPKKIKSIQCLRLQDTELDNAYP